MQEQSESMCLTLQKSGPRLYVKHCYTATCNQQAYIYVKLVMKWQTAACSSLLPAQRTEVCMPDAPTTKSSEEAAIGVHSCEQQHGSGAGLSSTGSSLGLQVAVRSIMRHTGAPARAPISWHAPVPLRAARSHRVFCAFLGGVTTSHSYCPGAWQRIRAITVQGML